MLLRSSMLRMHSGPQLATGHMPHVRQVLYTSRLSACSNCQSLRWSVVGPLAEQPVLSLCDSEFLDSLAAPCGSDCMQLLVRGGTLAPRISSTAIGPCNSVAAAGSVTLVLSTLR